MQKYIDNAVEQFRTLITEQLARQNRMEAGEQAKDFANLPDDDAQADMYFRKSFQHDFRSFL